MIIVKEKVKFISLMNLVGGIVDEINITFTPEKMIIKAIHCSNSNILFLEIDKNFFDTYEVLKDSTYTLCLDSLLKILRLCKEDVSISPEIDNIVFESGKRTFKLSYFVGEKEIREKPVFAHTSILKIDSKSFYSLLSECLVIDTIGRFKTNDNLFSVYLKSYKIKSDMSFENFKFISNINLETYFDLELLNLTSELKNVFEEVVIGMGKDLPLTLSCEDELIKCEFVLANRVE